MRKKLALAAALTLLLAGCAPKAAAPTPTPTATPTPTPAPAGSARILQATWLQVDETHRFWVALKETAEASPVTADPFDLGCEYSGLRVDFCGAEGDTLTDDSPYSFLDGYSCQPYELVFSVGDWNFDGHNDLAFTRMVCGSRYSTASFYIWDPETERFLQNPDGLDQLNAPALHPDEQVITSCSTAAGGSEWYDHYCYQDGVLQAVRKCAYVMDWDSDLFTATVEDRVDGAWQTVFSSEKEYGDDWVVYSRYREDLAHKIGPSGYWWGFPIDGAHDAFEVDTKGKLGTVLVTVELGGPLRELGGNEIALAVWSKDDQTAPIQTMTAECWDSFHCYVIADANFDGHMDFGYRRSWGSGGFFYNYWVWDEETCRFVEAPELSDYGSVAFDEETKTVRGHVKSGWAGLDAWDAIYRWEKGKLRPVRKIVREPREEENGAVVVTLTVTDWINGKETQVFSEEYTDETVWDEILKWVDVNYHGEES